MDRLGPSSNFLERCRFFCSPAGQRDQHQVFPHGLLYADYTLRSRSIGRPMSSSMTSGRSRAGRLESPRGRRVPCAFRAAVQQHGAALPAPSSLSSTIRDAAADRRRRLAENRPGTCPGIPQSRETNRENAAVTGALAVHLHGPTAIPPRTTQTSGRSRRGCLGSASKRTHPLSQHRSLGRCSAGAANAVVAHPRSPVHPELTSAWRCALIVNLQALSSRLPTTRSQPCGSALSNTYWCRRQRTSPSARDSCCGTVLEPLRRPGRL